MGARVRGWLSFGLTSWRTAAGGYNLLVGQPASPRDASPDITVPIAGEHFGAGIPIEQQAFVERRKAQHSLDDGSLHPQRRASDRPGAPSANSAAGPSAYRLRSRSEQDYPEAYLPVARELWEELTPAQREKAIRLQAIAMEKVGFEKGAPKYFIEDFDPATGQAISHPAVRSAAPQTGARANQPREDAGDYPAGAVLGGVLLGAGGTVLTLVLLGLLAPLVVAAGIGGAALLAGLVLAVLARG
jgi:hypothetical protein